MRFDILNLKKEIKMKRDRADEKLAKFRRAKALDRNEFRHPSEPRTPAAGITSFPVKAEDPAVRAMIDEALERRGK